MIFRIKFLKTIYKGLAKPILFRFDPEKVHDQAIKSGEFFGKNFLGKGFVNLWCKYKNKKLTQIIDGVEYSNPVGLAAGFDKNAKMLNILPEVGFGFVEIGSISAMPCEGNSKPRLWRLKKHKALRVNYGLSNDGAEIISKRIKTSNSEIPVGVSIARTNCVETGTLGAGIRDYVKSYMLLRDCGAYHTINISCPNVANNTTFLDPENLRELLNALQQIRIAKPMYVKISPDLDVGQLDKIIDLAIEFKLNGIICSNLTKKKFVTDQFEGSGGISGSFVSDSSINQIKYIYKKTNGQITLIACGGVQSPQDAYDRIKAGASLVQLITGMIYHGPQLVSEINHGLVRLLEQDGLNHISQAVGLSIRNN